MATYSWLCPQGHRATFTYAPVAEGPGKPPTCLECDQAMNRWYKSDGVGFATSGLKRRRESGIESNQDAARLFLETAEESAGPGDPDGSKAIDEWYANNAPANGNKNPVGPERPLHSRKVF